MSLLFNPTVCPPCPPQSGGLTDVLSLTTRFSDSNLVPTDAFSIALTFPDSNLVPTDALSLGIGLADTNTTPVDTLTKLAITAADSNLAPTDTFSIALTFPDSNLVPTETTTLSIKGFADTNVVPSDSLISLDIGVSDANAAPTDASTFVLELGLADTNATPTELTTLSIKGFADTNAAPTEARTSQANFWGNGSTGTSNVTNPANANGPNDAVSSSQQTAALGATTSLLTQLCGNSIAAGTLFSTAIYRGWFNVTVTLGTSVVAIKAHSSSALFTDVTVLSVSASVNHNTGDFTFDLIAAGINTLAKLQSVQFLYSTSDAAAGITPAVLTVDAGRIELTGVL